MREGGPDGWAVFAASPTPYLLLTSDLVIFEANPAYLHATAKQREDLVGRHLFDAFPDNPEDPGATGVRNLSASLERVKATGKPDTMAPQRYDIPVSSSDGTHFEERFWSPINTPVLDEDGHTMFLLHRVVDITDLMRARAPDIDEDGTGQAVRRAQEAEADLVARSQDLQRVNEHLRAAYDREQRTVLMLQRAMLPAPVTVEGMAIATRYLPAAQAAQVGGDWYDIIDLGAGYVSVAVGDIMGHGLAAAGVMGQMRSALAAATHADQNPAKALGILDTYARSVVTDLIATIVHAVVDRAGRTITYSSAGHPPGLLVAKEVQLLDEATAPPIAATVDPWARSQTTVAWPEGATLVLYTDGLIERRGLDIDEGLSRLAAAALLHADLDVEAFADALLEDLLPGGSVEDDVALVVARI